MQFDFKAQMTKRTDEELIQILSIDKDDYLPEALLAASEEFGKRNLQTEKVDSIAKDLSQKKEIEILKTKEPLSAVLKIATLLFPMVLTLILSGHYRSEGYDKKARDLVVWTLFGFCFYFIIIILIFVI